MQPGAEGAERVASGCCGNWKRAARPQHRARAPRDTVSRGVEGLREVHFHSVATFVAWQRGSLQRPQVCKMPDVLGTVVSQGLTSPPERRGIAISPVFYAWLSDA